MSDTKLRETVISSLAAVGASREAEFYAALFATQAPERFALIVIDPRCLKNPLIETLVGTLRLLSDLGLTPILLVGALDEDRTSVKFQSQRLAKELDQSSVRVAKLNTGTYALLNEIKRKTSETYIPILEMTERRGQMGLLQIVKDINPNKVIFLQPSGGLSKNGERIRNVSTEDIPQFLENEKLSVGQHRFLKFVSDIDAEQSEQRAYIMASPLNLLRELFTEKGSGTLIKRQSKIKKYKNYRAIDKNLLLSAIDNAFEKPLSSEYLKKPVHAIYLEENYKGGAIFTSQNQLLYLSKFWVAKSARGIGLSRDLWDEFTRDNPAFYWRSKLTNPFNNWYLKQCDGMQISGDWRIFWKGLDTFDVARAIKAAVQLPEDFMENSQ